MLTIAVVCFIVVIAMVYLQVWLEKDGAIIHDFYKVFGGLLIVIGFVCVVAKIGTVLWGVLP